MAASVKVVVAGTGPAPGPAAAVPDPGPRPADPAVLQATATCARGPGLPTAAVTGDDPGKRFKLSMYKLYIVMYRLGPHSVANVMGVVYFRVE